MAGRVMVWLLRIWYFGALASPVGKIHLVIIAEHKGRLGNQLFQLAGVLKLARSGERILLLGYEDLERFLDVPANVGFLNSRNRSLYQLATKAVGWVYRLPVSIRRVVLRSLQEDISTGVVNVVGSRGGLGALTLVKETYFLADQWLDFSMFNRLRIRDEWRQVAAAWLDQRGLSGCKCCFVHVRRGDYIRYPSVDQPGVLPARFFREMMDYMRAKGARHFILATDDWPWVLDALRGEPDIHLLAEGVELTLAVMALCRAGILSPSTFGWAAALFAGSAANPGCFLAPEYWVGFRRGRWYPYRSIQSRTLRYVPWQVSANETLQEAP